jgi:putative FmdB family regulatory protein
MPTYEFKCHRCGGRHVVVLSFQEKDRYVAYCEECGTKMTQVFSPAGIVFKGSGFYKNDSRPAPPIVSKDTTKPEKKTEAKKESSNDV